MASISSLFLPQPIKVLTQLRDGMFRSRVAWCKRYGIKEQTVGILVSSALDSTVIITICSTEGGLPNSGINDIILITGLIYIHYLQWRYVLRICQLVRVFVTTTVSVKQQYQCQYAVFVLLYKRPIIKHICIILENLILVVKDSWVMKRMRRLV